RLRTLRRLNSVTRRDGERHPGNEARVARAASAIVPFAESPLVDWIDAANRLMWRAVQDGRGSIPEIRLVRAGPEGVELLLATPLRDAPWPFTTRHDGRWWKLDPVLELTELFDLAEGCGRFLPALVPVGDDELASYLVPVGKGRRLSVCGDAQCVDAAISSIVIALRCLPWAEELGVELVGIDPPPPEEQCYQLSSSGQRALVDLARDRAHVESRLDSFWRRDPLVVVARGALASTDEPILERAGSVAGVISADDRGTEVLEVSIENAVLHPYGITLKAFAPSAGQLALVEALFRDARRPPEVVALRPGPERGLERLDELPAKGRVEVRLLRALPDVTGLERDLFSRDASRVVELLAYLCLHGMTAAIDAIAEALFPRSPAPARIARAENAAAAARSALQGVTAHQLLVRRGQNLFLDPSVTCDWLRAERALRAARFAAPERAERLASAAFELLGGSPFAGIVAGYSWLRAESLDESIAAELVDAAHRLAVLFLASGDVARARSAIEKGRLVEPDSEILARDLMAACDAEADRSGVRSTFSELEKALERIGANEPSLETRALFEALDNDR
ncbi:MAG TPA: bacterial transcriptional activator domain-containing protein, partial [Acidimicrobiales bacterium]|nr:bacterial transcriptional activator domain-containing protein [Acidimicrobiales bacterium]